MEPNTTEGLKSELMNSTSFVYEKAITSAQSISNNIINLHDKSYFTHRSILKTYRTTLFLIFLTHLIFFVQWRLKKTRKDVATSYRKLVGKKQFHRGVLALLSHPPPDGSFQTVPYNETSAETGTATRPLRTIDFGDSHLVQHRHTTERNSMTSPFIPRFVSERMQQNAQYTHFITKCKIWWRKIYSSLLHPLIHGHLAGLPLLTYISHILWQIRALEELYDFEYDHPSLPEENIDWLAISQMEQDVVKLLYPDFAQTPINSHKHYNGTRVNEAEPAFAYYRVLMALAMTSLAIDLLVTNRSLHSIFLKMIYGEQVFLDRTISTLAPLCSALLILFTNSFPHITINIIPFWNNIMRRPLGTVSSLPPLFAFMMSYAILAFLSSKTYPIAGVTFGAISGILWTKGITHFLASGSSGIFFIAVIIIGCGVSSKAEQQTCARPIGSIRFDWVPWVDYVSWDGSGRVQFSNRENEVRSNGATARNHHG